MSSVETGQMSAVETGQMSAVETRQMSAVETGEMSAVGTRHMSSAETRQMSTKTGRCPVSLFYISRNHWEMHISFMRLSLSNVSFKREAAKTEQTRRAWLSKASL